MVETELVEVEDRRFFCPECGEAWNLTIYPAPDALRIECTCEQVYWWSLKNKTLYHGITQAALDPGHMILFGTRLAEQLKTPTHETGEKFVEKLLGLTK